MLGCPIFGKSCLPSEVISVVIAEKCSMSGTFGSSIHVIIAAADQIGKMQTYQESLIAALFAHTDSFSHNKKGSKKTKDALQFSMHDA